MKLIVFILLLLFPLQIKAHSLELIGGSLTYHVTGNPETFKLLSNKLSSDGRLIYTGLMGLKHTWFTCKTEYLSLAWFKGKNSIDEPIEGLTASYGYRGLRWLEIGGIMGGYIQDNGRFYERGIKPYSISQGRQAIVPILGLELNFKVNINKVWYIKLNNIVSPVITNHSLSVGFNY